MLKPSCSQCKRAGRTCTGYRDPSGLRFRDESDKLRIKHQRLADSEGGNNVTKTASPAVVGLDIATSASKALTNSGLQSSSQVPTPTGSLLSLYLGTSAEDQATCFFFKNYVLADYKYHSSGFQYLLDVYGKEKIGTALSESVVSLGMVGLSHFWGASSIMAHANAKYNSALRLVSSRLRNIEEAKSDQTLIAVMLLGLYEVFSPNLPYSSSIQSNISTGKYL
jgi:hypothetical protein